MNSRFSSFVAVSALMLTTQAMKAETIGISGFLGASPGVCSIVPTTVCTNDVLVSGITERLCRVKPKTLVKIVGHSMGASGAIGMVRNLRACGVPARGVALDPQGQTDDPDVLAIYSLGWAGVGAGSPGAVCIGGGHWNPISDASSRAMARAFLATGVRPSGPACSATPTPNSSHGTILKVTP